MPFIMPFFDILIEKTTIFVFFRTKCLKTPENNVIVFIWGRCLTVLKKILKKFAKPSVKSRAVIIKALADANWVCAAESC